MSDRHLQPVSGTEYKRHIAEHGVVKYSRYTPRNNDAFCLHLYLLNEKNEIVGVKYPAMIGEEHYCNLNIYEKPLPCREEIWNNTGDYNCWEIANPLAEAQSQI